MQKKTKHQTFEVRTVHRSQLLNAPYNPRVIKDTQRKGLKKNLKKVGLLRPLVWNEPTGHLVEGHQRIDILDELEGTPDYFLDVAVTNLTDKVEREQNVFLNATTFTGEFDLPALKQMIEGGLDYSAAGLDLYDLNVIGVEDFAIKQPKTVQPDKQADGDDGDDYAEEVELTPEEKKQAIKEEKARVQERITNRAGEGETYLTLSFDSYKAKSGWMIKYGFGPDDLFVKGEIFQQIIEQKLKDGF
jgi:hypothetical protein